MDKEYIERNSLWKALDVAHLFDNGNPRHIAQQVVEEQPTADVVEVVHAYWKTREKHNDYSFVECSNCGFQVENYKAVNIGNCSTDIIGNVYNSCPICSAKMDGKKVE